MEQRLFCNKVIEMIKNCAIIVQTTIEVNMFWIKRASLITITTDENKARNDSEQENEFAWFLTTEKQMQKRDKNIVQWSYFIQRNKIIT